jgi:hypothetical protein
MNYWKFKNNLIENFLLQYSLVNQIVGFEIFVMKPKTDLTFEKIIDAFVIVDNF